MISPPTPLRISRIADKGVHILRAVSEASDQTSAVDETTTEPGPAETDTDTANDTNTDAATTRAASAPESTE